MKPLPKKVQTAPVSAVPSKTIVDPNTAASLPPQGTSVTIEKKVADEPKVAQPAAPYAMGLPYTVQVRATQNLGMAKDAVAALRSRGHDAFSEKVDLKGKGVWHRIFIGRFASENDARQYIQGKKIAAVYPDFMIRQATKKVGKDSETKVKP
jgi:cell division septation protein DedD